MTKMILRFVFIGLMFGVGQTTQVAGLEVENVQVVKTLKNTEDLANYMSLPYDNKFGKPNPDSVANNPYTKALISGERLWNEDTRTYSSKSAIMNVSEPYQPQSKIQSFDLPTFLVGADQVEITEAEPDKELEEKYIPPKYHGEKVIFPIHPDIVNDKDLAHIAEVEEHPAPKDIVAFPGASSRSLIVDDPTVPLHMDKLHLPRQISRYFRVLTQKHIYHSVNVSHELESIKDCPEFAYLPETIGVSLFPEGDKVGWGFLVRELTPRPIAADADKRLLIPFFSLYSSNAVDPNADPLLVILIKNSKEDPKTYILERIIKPLIKCWIAVFTQKGIIMESHGQNTLLELDSNLVPTRIVHRDLDNRIDCNRREKMGLPCTDQMFKSDKLIRQPNADNPRGSSVSLKYDSSISHHMLDYLAALMEKYFGVNSEELQKEAREYFQELFPDFRDYFPPTTYYYSDISSKWNTFPVVNTGKLPKWRPTYKEN